MRELTNGCRLQCQRRAIPPLLGNFLSSRRHVGFFRKEEKRLKPCGDFFRGKKTQTKQIKGYKKKVNYKSASQSEQLFFRGVKKPNSLFSLT